MDPMEEIKETFFIECEELLEVLEAGLIAMSEETHDDETVNAVFRAVHSIKGGAGAFALDCLVEFAHKFENVLDLVRSDKLETSAQVMDILLRSGDVLSDLVSAARNDNDSQTEASLQLLKELKALYSGGGEEESAAEESPATQPQVSDEVAGDEDEAVYQPQPISLDLDGDEEDPVYTPQPMALDFDEETGPVVRRFHIGLTAHPELFSHGSEVTLLMRALAEIGTVDASLDMSTVPAIEVLDLSKNLPKIEITLETEQEKSAIEEVFDFVDGECDLSIEEISTPIADPPQDPGDGEPTTNMAAPSEEATAPSETQAPDTEATPDVAAVKTDTEPTEKAAKASNTAAQSSRATVRVDVMRVDRLVNLVGELVVTQAGLSEYMENSGQDLDASSNNTMEEFKQLTRELQEGVMALRTQPVKPLFQRMQRISREAAAAAGKTVRLQTTGEATEVDRTVIERLSDPLTHMIRNAIDHGIEDPQKRADVNKDPVGSVTLSAAHRSGRVLIEVADDGGGINRDKVRAKAVERGLIAEDANLSHAEIDHLLFAPGFSTASAVTNLSGRGVGMDVVKRSIQALGGRISISSKLGKGTTFSISLPLTLAVLDGMIVRVDEHTVIVPLTAILETHKPSEEQLLEMVGEEMVLSIRGNLVPVVDVGAWFGYREPVSNVADHVAILIETEDGKRVALVVDDIVDQRQVVIKSLDENYGEVAGIAAATILGDGTIALILDTDELVAVSNPEALPLRAVA